MASIRKSLSIGIDPARAWDAFRDVGAIHTRLARGFVTGTELEGDTRTVTFANGLVVREQIVTIDDAARRLVYSASGGRTTHHNASFEVLDDGPGRTRVVWTTDLLPDEAAAAVAGMIEQGFAAIQATLEHDAD
jgi:carbon monoxide dehydrogenase subunit G